MVVGCNRFCCLVVIVLLFGLAKPIKASEGGSHFSSDLPLNPAHEVDKDPGSVDESELPKDACHPLAVNSPRSFELLYELYSDWLDYQNVIAIAAARFEAFPEEVTIKILKAGDSTTSLSFERKLITPEQAHFPEEDGLKTVFIPLLYSDFSSLVEPEDRCLDVEAYRRTNCIFQVQVSSYEPQAVWEKPYALVATEPLNFQMDIHLSLLGTQDENFEYFRPRNHLGTVEELVAFDFNPNTEEQLLKVCNEGDDFEDLDPHGLSAEDFESAGIYAGNSMNVRQRQETSKQSNSQGGDTVSLPTEASVSSAPGISAQSSMASSCSLHYSKLDSWSLFSMLVFLFILAVVRSFFRSDLSSLVIL